MSPPTGPGTVLTITHDEIGGPGHFEPVIRGRGFEIEEASFVDGSPPERALTDYAGVIVVGAPHQVDQDEIHPWLGVEKQAIRDVLDSEVPYLGVCFGGQLLAQISGGHVGPTEQGRHGWHRMSPLPEASEDPIFGALPEDYTTFTWHLYHFELPPEAIPLARSDTHLQAFRIRDKPAWGMQFHPELMPSVMPPIVDWIRDWIQDRPGSEITAGHLDRYLEDTKRFADHQKDLATRIASRFLDAIEGRSQGNG